MNIETLSINTIRTLGLDAIEKANSGHPGIVLGSAPMSYQLWRYHMKVNPANPKWINRDRFVLSAGHGSILLYSLLHLSGYEISLDDIKEFRNWMSNTPGHPEFGHTAGVDATTGPLGQGLAMAVGMTMAEAHLSKRFNKQGFPIIDHYTYVLCGDGDIMEGVSYEAASLAGHLGLGKLIVLYDSNDICLDGEVAETYSENTAQKFISMGWQHILVKDGENLKEINDAINLAKQELEKPTIIEIKTVIGMGSPNKAGKSIAHGSPLGQKEVEATKRNLNWPTESQFYIPDEVKKHFEEVSNKGNMLEYEWNKLLLSYKKGFPELYREFTINISGDWTGIEEADINLPEYMQNGESHSPRQVSNKVLNEISKVNTTLMGGSADLASSNMTRIEHSGNFSRKNYLGRNILYGVREFAMGAITNGLALHNGVRPYCSTFLVFSDYLKPAIRLSALMKLPAIYIFTHDSVSVGPDGPTHQPVEQLIGLRSIPNLTVIRPCDSNETVEAWNTAITNVDGPTVIVLARHHLPVLTSKEQIESKLLSRGGYVLINESDTNPDIQIIATGSEVSLAVEVEKILSNKGISARVISMPSWELYEKNSIEYKNSVILPHVKARLAIEMGSSYGWEKYIGDQGKVISVDTFGVSAPGEVIVKEYGFTTDNIIKTVEKMIESNVLVTNR